MQQGESEPVCILTKRRRTKASGERTDNYINLTRYRNDNRHTHVNMGVYSSMLAFQWFQYVKT